MALSGDIKQNYVDLQRSTGERFTHMADRLTSNEIMMNLDAGGRASNEELADWLRKQSDDEDAILRVSDPVAFARRQAGTKSDNAPKGRSQDNKATS